MDISFTTVRGNLRKDTGYGYAGWNTIINLQKLGHRVPYSHPKAPVQLFFSQPNFFKWYKDQYRIGYTPWESTELPKGWLDKFNDLDELWTTSEWCKNIYIDNGVNKPISVFHHGVDSSIFTSIKRVRGEKLKFLHVGEPAERKDAPLAIMAFREAFGNQDDVQLTIKSFLQSELTPKYNNVIKIEQSVSTEQLAKVYHDHHCLVYPSWGEGFGMIPLEALSTGMPVICTKAWAPYKEFILPLNSTLVNSPWPKKHPGQMYKPDFDQLVHLYRMVYDEYEDVAARAYQQAPTVHVEFDWLQLTKKAIEPIVQKFA